MVCISPDLAGSTGSTGSTPPCNARADPSTVHISKYYFLSYKSQNPHKQLPKKEGVMRNIHTFGQKYVVYSHHIGLTNLFEIYL